MTDRTVVHATIVLERQYAASPARVFAAWSNPEVRALWDIPVEGWEVGEFEQDFRPGGREFTTFGPAGDPQYRADGRYLDIVPNARVISAGTMWANGTPCSTSLFTLELMPKDGGTHLVLTDQSAYLDGLEIPSEREEGWSTILDNLGTYLASAE